MPRNRTRHHTHRYYQNTGLYDDAEARSITSNRNHQTAPHRQICRYRDNLSTLNSCLKRSLTGLKPPFPDCRVNPAISYGNTRSALKVVPKRMRFWGVESNTRRWSA